MNMTKNALSGAVLFALLAGTLPVAAADGSSPTKPVVKKKVYQKPLSDAYVTANFGVNRSLGRAWVEVAASPWVDNQQRNIIVRKSIKWLYYDPDRKAVIYQHGATETICAEDRGLLGGPSLKSTENCELRVISARRNIDDGFTVDKEPVTTVTFVARNFRPRSP
jgi:hypothetical protein